MPITWRCHVCKAQREDPDIDVAQGWTNRGGVILQTSARFCVDKISCRIGAVLLAGGWLLAGVRDG